MTSHLPAPVSPSTSGETPVKIIQGAQPIETFGLKLARRGLGVGLVVALVLQTAGVPLDHPIATVGASLAILVFGLPHGTLDIELIRRQYALSRANLIAVLALYLALAASTFLLWRYAPVAALVVFLSISVIHFAEDWVDVGHLALALGLGTALLTAPSLLHFDDVAALFVGMTGQPEARSVASAIFPIAPLSLALASIAVARYWKTARRDAASSALFALASMLFLPPAIGFALFFCLLHSPKHFSEALTELSWPRFRQWRRIVVPLTSFAAGLALVLYAVGPPMDFTVRIASASFMTLSVLVVPHIAVPIILSLLKGRWLADNDRAN